MSNEFEEKYNHKEIEKYVQNDWEIKETYSVNEDYSANAKQKFYCLSMFPYPSGRIHIGHVRNYTIGDFISRHKKMLGYHVLQPMGWDAFGLPAENAALQNKIAPSKWTYANIAEMRKELKSLGLAIDWKREIATCDPEYYKWEQWLFIKMYEMGLVYRKESLVNWDPVDNTVLANEQVVDGKCWRSGAIVEQRKMPQWYIKTKHYEESLLQDLDELSKWPEEVIKMQRNWIGKSMGALVKFKLKIEEKIQGLSLDEIEIFTTRLDTLFGVTAVLIALDHPIAEFLSSKSLDVKHFIVEMSNISIAESEISKREKSGIQAVLYAIHPLNQENIPIYICNFVLMEYGTGAVMCVPSHDERDSEFAIKYNIPFKQVIVPSDAFNKATSATLKSNDGITFFDDGVLINSADFNGFDSNTARQKILEKLMIQNLATPSTKYRLRDWCISRQRYWGAPIPFVYCEYCGVNPVNINDLPVRLPINIELNSPASPLKVMDEFIKTKCPKCSNENAKRETDTFDTFFESSWYYARYASWDQSNAMLDDRANYWLPVDQYIGGIEHATLHLLYARLIHKIMRDIGLVNTNEPFLSLLAQGMVLKDGAKMSKSKGNIISPVDVIEKYGADSMRLFILFANSPELSIEWSDSGINGAYRFITRLYSFVYNNIQILKTNNNKTKIDITELNKIFEKNNAIKKIYKNLEFNLNQVNIDVLKFQFNTVISGAMKIFNSLIDLESIFETNKPDRIVEIIITIWLKALILILHPAIPHVTKYLWNEVGYGGEIELTNWLNSKGIADIKYQEVEVIFQINGKFKKQITMPKGFGEKQIEDVIKQDPLLLKYIDNKKIKKTIIVADRLVNLVTE